MLAFRLVSVPPLMTLTLTSAKLTLQLHGHGSQTSEPVAV